MKASIINPILLRNGCASLSSHATATKPQGAVASVPAVRMGESVRAEKLPGGITVASVAGTTPFARVSAIFQAGSRHESHANRGITHLLRRSCGLATEDFSQFGLTRTLQQMGAGLQCSTTREHLIYTVECAPNYIHEATKLMAATSTKPLFYNWELSDVAYKYMRHDLELLNRRKFDKLLIELLHEASYHDTTLGRSLFSPAYSIGYHSLESLQAFCDSHLTANSLTLVGAGVPHDFLVETAESFAVKPSSDYKAAPSKFFGGELRRDIPLPATHCCIAWEGVAGNTLSDSLSQAVLSRALGGPPGERVRWGSGLGRLGRAMGEEDTSSAAGINLVYKDSSLIGFEIVGDPGKMGSIVKSLHAEVMKVGSGGLQQEDFDKAKIHLKADILMSGESSTALLHDVAAQLSHTGKALTPAEIITELDKVTLNQVNQVAKKVFAANAPKSMAAVGDLITVPYLCELKS